jgi:hypothetical protein
MCASVRAYPTGHVHFAAPGVVLGGDDSDDEGDESDEDDEGDDDEDMEPAHVMFRGCHALVAQVTGYSSLSDRSQVPT